MINKVSKLVADQFPDFYKEEGPLFLAFMEAYYAYLEENNNLQVGHFNPLHFVRCRCK